MASVFVSYRPADDGDYAETLVRELSDAIRRISAAAVQVRLFLSSDEEIAGGDWSEAAAAALAECTVFLAVCSERYVLTERCGREWWAFQDRLRQHEADTGRSPRALVPLAWGRTTLPEQLPAGRFASDIGLGEDVRALARLRVNQPRYRELVERLAQHIALVSREDPPRRAVALLPYRATPNAFRRPARRATATPAVRFVVAAGRREEMAAVREDLEYYGSERADWGPYRPADTGPLARRAQAVAADHLFSSEVVDDVEDIVELLARADAEDEVVVMLVDAWVVRINGYRAALAEAERHRAAVMVPFSADDAETRRARAALSEALARLLEIRGAHADRLLRIGAETAEAFDDELGEVLETARRASVRASGAHRRAPTGRPPVLPLLDAP